MPRECQLYHWISRAGGVISTIKSVLCDFFRAIIVELMVVVVAVVHSCDRISNVEKLEPSRRRSFSWKTLAETENPYVRGTCWLESKDQPQPARSARRKRKDGV